LEEFCEYLRSLGHRPYLIPGGASEHRLGSFGYMNCAAEILRQSKESNVHFDYLVHCTGSSSTQAGLLAGFAALGKKIHVVGIADDDETAIKKGRVLQLANKALDELDFSARVDPDDVVVLSIDQNVYGKADESTRDAIRLLAQAEGLIADPVYEAKAVRGLLSLAEEKYFSAGSKILLMHLGGSPAIHAYADQLGVPNMEPLPI
nr:pyridoxal-phosphate dependent enzyme [Acidiferrobacterales bacterium]